eukprot:sb/3469324/
MSNRTYNTFTGACHENEKCITHNFCGVALTTILTEFHQNRGCCLLPVLLAYVPRGHKEHVSWRPMEKEPWGHWELVEFPGQADPGGQTAHFSLPRGVRQSLAGAFCAGITILTEFHQNRGCCLLPVLLAYVPRGHKEHVSWRPMEKEPWGHWELVEFPGQADPGGQTAHFSLPRGYNLVVMSAVYSKSGAPCFLTKLGGCTGSTIRTTGTVSIISNSVAFISYDVICSLFQLS